MPYQYAGVNIVPQIEERYEDAPREAEMGADEIKMMIKRYCAIFNADCVLAQNIAKCESGYEAKAKNPNSSASGIYQFIKSTYRENCEGDVFNAEDNIKCGVRLIAEKKFSHWHESVKCWLKM